MRALGYTAKCPSSIRFPRSKCLTTFLKMRSEQTQGIGAKTLMPCLIFQAHGRQEKNQESEFRSQGAGFCSSKREWTRIGPNGSLDSRLFAVEPVPKYR
jgi:hypothetical protein